MRAATLVLLTLAFSTALVVGTPLAAAKLPSAPPEYIGGYCGWHWHGDVDLVEGEYPHYHYHHCI